MAKDVRGYEIVSGMYVHVRADGSAQGFSGLVLSEKDGVVELEELENFHRRTVRVERISIQLGVDRVARVKDEATAMSRKDGVVPGVVATRLHRHFMWRLKWAADMRPRTRRLGK